MAGVTGRRRATGDRGEALAAAWLEQRGYAVIDRNVRLGRKEIDLICRYGTDIVFVEVKSGHSDRFGHPAHRVDGRKRKALVEAAQQWIAGHPEAGSGFRFDVVTVEMRGSAPAVEHFPAAFSADDV